MSNKNSTPRKTTTPATKPLAPGPTKHGILVLLDALGTRTATIDQSRSYLSALAILRSTVEVSLQMHLAKHPKKTLDFYNKLSLHFFGDSVLMIYDTAAGEPLYKYIDYLTVILQFFYIAALEAGILFRGAISIGEYLQQENVVLGPAVSDAAVWYDQFDFIGTAATPFATRQIRNAFYERHPKVADPLSIEAIGMLLYPVPLKQGGTVDLFAVNWPGAIGYKTKGPLEDRKFLRLYSALMNRYPIPFGTERKFANTEAFVKAGCVEWTN